MPMQQRSRFWWRTTLPFAFLTVVVVSAWSWWVQPETSQLGFARIPGGAQSSLILTNEQAVTPLNAPSVAWRMHLRLDSGFKAPGPSWVMFEGQRLGQGYELHWQPARLCLTLLRSAAPLVLGAVKLEQIPNQVTLVRRGFYLQIIADERVVLSVVDPQTTPATHAWGFQAAGPMEGSTVSLFDEQRGVPITTVAALSGNQKELQAILLTPSTDDHVLFAVRQALTLDAEKNLAEKNSALLQAKAALGVFTAETPLRIELEHWLAWAQLHAALARNDGDAVSVATAAMINFATRCHSHPTEETIGLAMELLDPLVRRCARPIPRAPADVLAWRATWFSMLELCATIALEHQSPVLSNEWQWQLKILVHASLCLRGLPGKPTPAEAPEWVTTRWRAFAGGNPGVSVFPPVPQSSADERNPIRSTIDRFMQLAAFEPGGMNAVALRAKIMAALSAPPINQSLTSNHARALEVINQVEAPARELILTRALLALQDVGDTQGDVQAALNALDPDPQHRAPISDGEIPLARRDPFAYALFSLLQYRHQGSNKSPQPLDPFSKPLELPEALQGPYGRLLSGQPYATHEVAWLPDPNVLPPVQTLAAALAMQEVLGNGAGSANWSLLDQIPCFTLPTHLMKPDGKTSPRTDPTAPLMPVVP
jgi:hypothetical protein